MFPNQAQILSDLLPGPLDLPSLGPLEPLMPWPFGRPRAHMTNRIFILKVPQVKGKVLWYECGTPISDSNFLQSYHGGSYGTRCNTEYFNPNNSNWIMRADTPIKNLYLAGQDAWTPAVAGAMYGGLLSAIKVWFGQWGNFGQWW